VLLGAAMTIPSGIENCIRILDIGTGTGTIALMAAQRCPEGIIDAIDIDEPSATEAAQNFEASPWQGRLHAHHVSLKDFLPAIQYDLICSNPPYFDNSLTNPDLRVAEARHNLSLSWKDILIFSSKFLSETGILSIILPSDFETILRREAGSRSLFLSRMIRIRTTATKPVSRIISEFSRIKTVVTEEELILQKEGKRTKEYISLTDNFYINQ